jgi:hypothetical protein
MWTDIVFGYVCPSLGCIMAAAMFAGTVNDTDPWFFLKNSTKQTVWLMSFVSFSFIAPVNDLRQALIDGNLGSLNPLPWAFMTGNCVVRWTCHD